MPEQVNPDDVPEVQDATVSDVIALVEELQLTVERLLQLMRIAVLTAACFVLGMMLADLVL